MPWFQNASGSKCLGFKMSRVQNASVSKCLGLKNASDSKCVRFRKIINCLEFRNGSDSKCLGFKNASVSKMPRFQKCLGFKNASRTQNVSGSNASDSKCLGFKVSTIKKMPRIESVSDSKTPGIEKASDSKCLGFKIPRTQKCLRFKMPPIQIGTLFIILFSPQTTLTDFQIIPSSLFYRLHFCILLICKTKGLEAIAPRSLGESKIATKLQYTV